MFIKYIPTDYAIPQRESSGASFSPTMQKEI